MPTFAASILNSSSDSLTISLSGRVTSDNAGKAEEEIAALRTQSPKGKLVLDVENTEYLSSAGLRVIMRLCKVEGSLRIVNASPEVYDVFEMTGLTEIMEVRRAMRHLSVEGCELLGSGANGDVYRLAKDEMIKVFRPTLSLDDIEDERRVSRQVFVLGVPCAIPFDTVRCGDCYGTVYEALDAKTIAECVRENPKTLRRYAVDSARLLKELHAIEVPEGALPPADRTHHSRLDMLTNDFSADELAVMHGLLRSLPAMSRFVHNDYHVKNVMDSKGQLMLIDLGDAGAGNPLLDVIHTYFICNMMGSGIRDHDKDEMSFVGLTYGELDEFWAAFLPTYCGSEERAARLDDLLEPWGWLLYLSSSMSHPRLPQQYHAPYAALMRERVLARTDEMRERAEEMSALCG
ncbi:MAG: phosphotransferase [Coriobacteriales bacterium]|nr:phosphotransferase [Coriobacteriales bacterium]